MVRERKRLEKMNRKTDILSVREEQMKQIAGRNQAITNTVILAADLIMLFAAVMLYQRYEVGYAGVILPVLALMSSLIGCCSGRSWKYIAEYLCSRQPCTGYS